MGSAEVCLPRPYVNSSVHKAERTRCLDPRLLAVINCVFLGQRGQLLKQQRSRLSHLEGGGGRRPQMASRLPSVQERRL